MTATVETRARHIPAVATAGAALVLVALVLYAIELSRAVAVTPVPFALCLFGAAWFAHFQGRWPSRPWRIIFAVLVIAALAFGVGLYVYGQIHPPMAT